MPDIYKEIKRNTVPRSRNHSHNRKAKMFTPVYSWPTCHCQQYKRSDCCALSTVWWMKRT